MRAFVVRLEGHDDEDPLTLAQDILDTLTTDGINAVAVNPWGETPVVSPQTPPEAGGFLPP